MISDVTNVKCERKDERRNTKVVSSWILNFLDDPRRTEGRCLRYTVDKSKPKVYQWFDLRKY